MTKTMISLLGSIVIYTTSVNAASFDCAKASSIVEQTICNNKELSEIDIKLSTLYRSALSQTSQQNSIRAAQRSWLAERNNCGAELFCLKNSYNLRINQLENKQINSETVVKTEISKENVLESSLETIPAPKPSMDPLAEMLAKQKALIDASKFLNLQCKEGSRNGKFPEHPYTYLIRHETDKTATIIFYPGEKRLGEGLIMRNQNYKKNEKTFSYDPTDYERYRRKQLQSLQITQYNVDRVEGNLLIGTKYKNPLYKPNRGGNEFMEFYDYYPCKKVADQTYDRALHGITLTKKQKEEDQKIIDKANSDKIRNERKF
jgi:uncharacterized protein